MNSPILRIEQLIRLATDPAASEAESRTSAMIAVQSIRKNNLRICASNKKKRKGFKARRELKFTLHGLERRMDHIESFLGKAKVETGTR